MGLQTKIKPKRLVWMLERAQFFFIFFFSLTFSFSFANPAFTAGKNPRPQLDPNRTEKQIDANQAMRKRSKQAHTPTIDVGGSRTSGDTLELFVLNAVLIDGATAFSKEELAKYYRPFIGRSVSQSDLLTIIQDITEHYRRNGFRLSRAILPPQDIDGGRVRVQILEGTIDDIVLEGGNAENFGARNILEPLTAERPLKLKTLERHLLLVNDTPGVLVVDTELEEIGEATGSFRIIVYLETWHIWSSLNLDNRGTEEVGPLQAYLSTAYNSSIIDGDTFAIDLSTIPDSTDELKFGRVTYEAPITGNGIRIGAIASLSRIQPSDERRFLNTFIETENYEIKGSLTPIRNREMSLFLTAIANLRNEGEHDLTGANYSDRIRAVSLITDFQHHDETSGSTYLTLNTRQGLDILDASKKGDDLLSNSDGSGEFSKLFLSVTRYQILTDDWTLKLVAAGQVASTALLSAEEFYIGGPEFGRAYDGGELSGDNGLAGSIELIYDRDVNWEYLDSFQLYAFLDAGSVWNLKNGSDHYSSLSSYGLGARFFLAYDFTANIEVALPTDDHTSAVHGDDTRVFFSLSKTFKSCHDEIAVFCR